MKKRKKSDKQAVPDDPQAIAERARAQGVPEEDLQGPPARETIMIRDDREREAEQELAFHTESSPKLTAGDLDADWQRAIVLDVPVRLIPPEEMIWSKSFVRERERYDGADVAHVLRACADTLDWPRLVRRFDAHWRVLLHHLVSSASSTRASARGGRRR